MKNIWPAKEALHRQARRIGLPFCQGLEGPCFRLGRRRPQRTSYVNDEDNWVFMCDGCAEKNDRYWEEMWEEYYRGCL